MVCHPSKGHRGDSIYDQIRAYYGRTGQNAGVHLFGRLDKDTSGIVGIAKNKMTADRMQRQRQQGRFQKEYLALVWGDLRHHHHPHGRGPERRISENAGGDRAGRQIGGDPLYSRHRPG